VAGLQAAVLVPVTVRELGEADAGLDKTAGKQTLAAESEGSSLHRLRRIQGVSERR
jgi:hypothetical protein